MDAPPPPPARELRPVRDSLLLLLYLPRGLLVLLVLLVLLLDLLLPLCSRLGRALPGLGREALALLRGRCAGTERPPPRALRGRELARRGLGAGLGAGRLLGKGCLMGARSLLTVLAALWGSPDGPTLRVTDLLAAFLVRVSGRATAVAVQLWPRCQLAFKLLCSATVVFISIYFLVTSLVNVCLVGTQSFSAAFVTLWDSLAMPVLAVTDLLAAILAHVSNGAITVSMLLWWPCQVAFELLCSVTKVFISIYLLVSSLVKGLLSLCLMGTPYLFMPLAILWDLLAGLVLGVTNLLVLVLVSLLRALSILLLFPFQLAFKILSFTTWVFTSIFFIGVYILGLLLRFVFLMAFFSVIYCNRELLWALMRHVQSRSRRLQPVLWQLYQVAVQSLGRAVASQQGRRLVDWVLQVIDGSRGGRMMNQGRDQLDAAAGQRHQTPREEPGSPGVSRRQQLNAAAWNAEGTSGNNPWALLKEQEERKKCVICQDQTKTVLLMPCRHLCLCQECTEMLLQQDIHQRNCPLCRQMILQTVNVYL